MFIIKDNRKIKDPYLTHYYQGGQQVFCRSIFDALQNEPYQLHIMGLLVPIPMFLRFFNYETPVHTLSVYAFLKSQVLIAFPLNS